MNKHLSTYIGVASALASSMSDVEVGHVERKPRKKRAFKAKKKAAKVACKSRKRNRG